MNMKEYKEEELQYLICHRLKFIRRIITWTCESEGIIIGICTFKVRLKNLYVGGVTIPGVAIH